LSEVNWDYYASEISSPNDDIRTYSGRVWSNQSLAAAGGEAVVEGWNPDSGFVQWQMLDCQRSHLHTCPTLMRG